MLVDDDYATNLYHEIIINDDSLAEHLIICTSVDDAIDHLSNDPKSPDLILLDMNLPLRNAWDFLEECKQKQLLLKSKVIILSTTKNPDDIKKAESNPQVSAFMTKPLDLDLIKTYLKNEL